MSLFKLFVFLSYVGIASLCIFGNFYTASGQVFTVNEITIHQGNDVSLCFVAFTIGGGTPFDWDWHVLEEQQNALKASFFFSWKDSLFAPLLWHKVDTLWTEVTIPLIDSIMIQVEISKDDYPVDGYYVPHYDTTMYASIVYTQRTTLKITQIHPHPESVICKSPETISAYVNKDFIIPSLNEETFYVIASGGDGNFTNRNERKIYGDSISFISPTEIHLHLGDAILSDDIYQVKIKGGPVDINSLDAELLSLELSGDLLPPPTLYEQIRHDLSIIRSTYPTMTSICHFPRWAPGQLLVILTPEAMEQYRNGEFQGLDSLNAEYGVLKIESFTIIDALHITFAERYNPERLVPLYAAVEGVISAHPNRSIGDGNDIEIIGTQYVFSLGWGDCPSGCIHRHVWNFTILSGIAELVNDYGTPLEFPLSIPIVIDLDGEPIDGEFKGAFPSGDGYPGGDFETTFIIDHGLRADVTQDGFIDVLDVVMAINCILGTSILDNCAIQRADCDGNGVIDITDVVGIINTILGLGYCSPQ